MVDRPAVQIVHRMELMLMGRVVLNLQKVERGLGKLLYPR